MRPVYFIFLTLPFLVFACRQPAGSLFMEIPSSSSGVTFSNDLVEDVNFNILTYEYLYNGGGVATGDLNNDGLPDIMLTGNMVSNKLYLNRGGLKFEDITKQAGVAGRDRWKTGVVMADVNGDGFLDMYVCYSGPGTDEARKNELYINDARQGSVPTFTEKAAAYGLDAPGTYSTTASFFDMDNDGDLDMFLVNHADMFYNPFFNTEKLRSTRHPRFGNRLYRNDNGRFNDISEAAGIAGSGLNFGLSVAASDINNDGWVDIYVTNDYDERDFLYLNDHKGSFREVLNKAAGHISEFAMGSDIADYNNDGRPDIMVLDMLPEDNHRHKLLKGADTYDKYSMRVKHGFHHQQMRNTLQLNNGNDQEGVPIFSEVAQMAGVAKSDWSWAPLFADFDNDGLKDLFVSNGMLRDITNLDFVKYTSGYSNNFTNAKGDKEEMWQLINDMPSTRLTNYFFRNNGDLGFTNESEAWGLGKRSISNGAAYADLDNDGDLDLVVNCLNDNATLYENRTVQATRSHFTKIQLRGAQKNTQGIGARIFLRASGGSQMKEQFTARGFQSSVDPVIHFGLGRDSLIDTIRVLWPGGRSSLVTHVKSNTLIRIDEGGAFADSLPVMRNTPKLFTDVTASSGIRYDHVSSPFVDFKISPLLPFQPSKIGPAATKGDVNGDGFEDFFVGGSPGHESILYLQTGKGIFRPAPRQPWNEEKSGTAADALFFDPDNDGDMDLYIVCGGGDDHLNSRSYQDRLYENDGNGNFASSKDALPAETVSGSCARAADYNNDGLIDLFIGGKLSPGLFPIPPESFVYRNVSTKGSIRFEKDLTQADTILKKPGIVTDAVWADLNKDGWQDLVVVGMFMPVTVFENIRGQLRNRTKEYGLENTEGWWCRILAEDLDNDGDSDLVVGNMGTNLHFPASAAEPVSITYADFNEDGVIDPILSYYNKGRPYPYYSRDEILEQLPALQKRFARYIDFADAQLADMFTPEQLSAATTVNVKMLQSVYISNDGGRLQTSALPSLAQVSAVNGIVTDDLDNDGMKEIIIAGNFYPFRVQLGPMDAGTGIVLQRKAGSGYTAKDYSMTGLYIHGDVRNLVKMASPSGTLLIAVKNNDSLQVIRRTND